MVLTWGQGQRSDAKGDCYKAQCQFQTGTSNQNFFPVQ